MKLTTTLFWWALLFSLPIQVFGQKSAVSNAQIVKNYAFFKNSDPGLSHENYFEFP